MIHSDSVLTTPKRRVRRLTVPSSSSTRRHASACGAALMLVLLVCFPTTSSSSSTTPSSSTTTPPPSIPVATKEIDCSRDVQAAARRAAYVRRVLQERIQYVQQGQRTRDFTKWVGGGTPQIFSTHGVEQHVDYQQEELQEDNDNSSEEQQQRKGDPFSSNRLNLDLVNHADAPPRCYTGKAQHLVDLTPPQFLQLAVRAVRLAFNFSPVLSTLGLAYFSSTFRTKVWYKWLASCLASSGAAWIKWGQWSGTRSDMFPQALCDALSVLHNDAPAHSYQYSQTIMESSLGLAPGTLLAVFDSFDPQPLASGSIAQVHRATVGGHPVAVKIRHPRVGEVMALDFQLMSTVATVCDWIPALRWIRVRDSVQQFSTTMSAQAYLHVEAHHLEVLNHNFKDWPQVSFPRPYYSSSAMIVESFEPGLIVSDVLELYNQQAAELNQNRVLKHMQKDDYTVEEVEEDHVDSDNNQQAVVEQSQLLEGHDIMPLTMAKFFVTTGHSIYLKMLLIDNLMHADLHPGNVIFDTHRTSREAHKVQNDFGFTLVDAGMVAQLSEHETGAFVGFLSSIGEGDGAQAAKFALQFSDENKSMDKEAISAFTADMVDLMARLCRGYFTGSDVGETLRGLLQVIRDHQVRIDANYATLVVNLLCIEGLAKDLFPTYSVIDHSKPLLQAYRKLCFTKDGTFKPDAPKSPWVKMILASKIVEKKLMDRNFFAAQAKIKKRKHIVEQQLLK